MLHTLIKHDLKALQAFVAIVECQGVTAAQKRLNMSQSAISMHLAHLEESLGVILCRRGRSGFGLTKAGISYMKPVHYFYRQHLSFIGKYRILNGIVLCFPVSCELA